MTQARADGYEAVHLTTFTPEISNETPSRLHPRQTYRRQLSTQSMEYSNVRSEDHHLDDLTDEMPRGLGLRNVQNDVFGISRIPVGRKSPSGPTPNLTKAQSLSPEASRSDFSQASTFRDSPSPYKSNDMPNTDWSRSDRSSFTPSHRTISHYNSDVDLIKDRPHADQDCPTQGDVLTSPWSSLTVTILVLAIYSTIFSGVFLGIALAKPRWGNRIGVQGGMSYPTATLLSALFSKTVELSFVTVFVALLGQILSRRAFSKTSGRGQGISIAEMTMRTWIMQPGSLFTHWRTVRYAAVTVLGAVALLATLAATFYTTAAEALVAPKLKFGPYQSRVLSGSVSMAFANSKYLSDNCDTPVTTTTDPTDKGTTCLQIEYAGQSYHDFSTWLAEWQQVSESGNATRTSSMQDRPKPFAMFLDNTTVTGQWITPSNENVTADSLKHGRYVQNVTMVMPHTNIFNAVRMPANYIPQPQDLQGQGEYDISASLPAPALNVLCVSMTPDELEPMIYNASNEGPRHIMPPTAVDDLFNFGNATGQQPAAQFAKIPISAEYSPQLHGDMGPERHIPTCHTI